MKVSTRGRWLPICSASSSVLLILLTTAVQFPRAMADSSGSCDSNGGDMVVPSGSTGEVQITFYPQSTDGSCTGTSVVSSFQSDEWVKVGFAQRRMSCCSLGNSVVVTDTSTDSPSTTPYSLATGSCVNFQGETTNPMIISCQSTSSVPISLEIDGQTSCLDVSPDMQLPTFEGCLSTSGFSYKLACDGEYGVIWSSYSTTGCKAANKMTSSTLELGCNEVGDGSIEVLASGCTPSTDQRDLIILGVVLGIVLAIALAFGVYCGIKVYDRKQFEKRTSMLDL